MDLNFDSDKLTLPNSDSNYNVTKSNANKGRVRVMVFLQSPK